MSVNPTPLTPKTRNKMSPLIVMASLAIVLGLIAAGGIWQYLNRTQQKIKELSVTRAVVIASMPIQAGAKITEADLSIKQLPAQAVPKDYPSSIESIKGRIVKNTIQAEEVITEARLVGEGAAGGLPVVIPKDQRAITIMVNEVVGVGGFINPGDHVDILSILKKDENTFSKTILQNVLILAVGDKIMDPNILSDPAPKLVSQVTVALTPKDSEKLALAEELGELHLVLRPHGENKSFVTEGATLEDVYGFLPGPPVQYGSTSEAPLAISTTANAPKNSVEVILGSRKTYFYY